MCRLAGEHGTVLVVDERVSETFMGPGNDVEWMMYGWSVHPSRLYLIDQRGQIREIYSLAFFNERQAFLDIQVLLREPE